MFKILANLIVLFGSIFILISTIGLWRLPSLYLKMHAATKSGTLGCGLILLGVGMQIKNIHSITEIILLILFIAITNPISAHLVGKLHFMRESATKTPQV